MHSNVQVMGKIYLSSWVYGNDVIALDEGLSLFLKDLTQILLVSGTDIPFNIPISSNIRKTLALLSLSFICLLVSLKVESVNRMK